jgi:hypothetical protein
MYDRIKIRLLLTEDENCIVRNTFEDEANSVEDDYGDMTLNWKIGNLKCILKDNKYFIIDGSIHKYYKGNNYGDFNLAEVINAIEKINKDIGIDLSEADILILEAGFNLTMNKKIGNYLKILKSYKGQIEIPYMNPLPGTSRLAGKRLTLSNLILKFYDKKWDTVRKEKIVTANRWVIPDNLLRIELFLKSPRIKLLKSGRKFKDLRDENIFIEVKDILIAYYNDIIKLEYPEIPSTLRPQEAILMNGMFEPDGLIRLNDYLKTQTRDIRKYYRRKIKSILNKIPKSDKPLEMELTEKIECKWRELLGGRKLHPSSAPYNLISVFIGKMFMTIRIPKSPPTLK